MEKNLGDFLGDQAGLQGTFDLGSLDAALEHGDLLAKGEVLEHEARSLRDQCVHQLEEQGDPGVGKSTLSMHLAGWLAGYGHGVIVVDADPQRSESGPCSMRVSESMFFMR